MLNIVNCKTTLFIFILLLGHCGNNVRKQMSNEEINLRMCTFVMGDGTGGTDDYIGETTTEDECAQLVQSKTPSANGATWGVQNENCYAEFGATSNDGDTNWRTCLFKGPVCGTTRCKFGWECCMTCDEQGQLIPDNRCESKLDGLAGCPVPECTLPETATPSVAPTINTTTTTGKTTSTTVNSTIVTTVPTTPTTTTTVTTTTTTTEPSTTVESTIVSTVPTAPTTTTTVTTTTTTTEPSTDVDSTIVTTVPTTPTTATTVRTANTTTEPSTTVEPTIVTTVPTTATTTVNTATSTDEETATTKTSGTNATKKTSASTAASSFTLPSNITTSKKRKGFWRKKTRPRTWCTIWGCGTGNKMHSTMLPILLPGIYRTVSFI